MRTPFLAVAVLGLCLATAPHTAFSAAAAGDHGDTIPVGASAVAVVELFTSEGCSSCPPADALLRRIHLKTVSSGQLIVGLSEHVTYWNQLGWKDAYSDQVFTDRQERYAASHALEGPYTPQMVVNGGAEFVGSNAVALQRAMQADAARPHADLRIRSLTKDGDALQVSFILRNAGSAAVDIMAAVTDDADESNVAHGENAGRHLQHVAVARTLTRVATVTGDAEQTVRVPLPAAAHASATAGRHLVLFAQQPHQGRIVGAATLPL